MNREVLFRGKRVDYGEWVYGLPYSSCYDNEIDQIVENDCHVDIHQKTVSQFTGLTDKKGVKIFEGDYLRDDYSDDDGNIIESSVKVFWDNENAQWSIDNSFKQDGSSLTNLIDYLGFDNLEVINNE